MSKQILEIGMTILIFKPELNNLFKILAKQDFKVVGPQIKDHTVILGPIERLADLPKGYISQEKPGKYTLTSNGKEN